MKGRLMYIPREIAASLGCDETQECHLNTIKGRIEDFSAVSMLKILSQLQAGPRTFSDLYVRSGIRYKRSYIRYLRLCSGYGFVSRVGERHRVFYHITDKGRSMLRLFADGPCKT